MKDSRVSVALLTLSDGLVEKTSHCARAKLLSPPPVRERGWRGWGHARPTLHYTEQYWHIIFLLDVFTREVTNFKA